MRTIINTAIFATLVVSAFTPGCMRYSPDRVFDQNTSALVSVVGADGRQMVTNASYRNWGRGPGTDGVYGTNDDDVTGYTRVTREKSGRLEAIVAASGPGPDTLWFTADDELVALANKEGNDANEVWTFGAVQFANISVVLDDILNPPSLRKLQTDFPFSFLSNASPLSRGFLELNRVERYRLLDSRYSGWYRGNWSDLWIDGDKGISRITRKKVANGYEIRSVSFPGQDGVWSTQDDIADALWRVVQSGTVFSIFQYTSPGPDQLWGTVDDAFSYGIYLEYNADGDIILEKYITNMGVDALPFNGDDMYSAVIERRYWAKDGKEFTSVRSLGSGSNGNGLSTDKFVDESIVLYVRDVNLLPGILTGPSTVSKTYGVSPKVWTDHLSIAFSESGRADRAIELKARRGKYVCFPTNLVTLEPCSELSAKTDAGIGGSYDTSEQVQTFRQIAPDSWEVKLNVPPLEEPFRQKLIIIDRVGP